MNGATVATDAGVNIDPRLAVRAVSMRLLVDAIVGDEPFGLCSTDDGAWWFVCQRCGRRNHNGGTAQAVDDWRWRCTACRFTGTRIALERIVLERSDALDRFFALLPAEVDRMLCAPAGDPTDPDRGEALERWATGLAVAVRASLVDAKRARSVVEAEAHRYGTGRHG